MSQTLLKQCSGTDEVPADAAGFVPDLVVGEAERGHAGEYVGAITEGIALLG